jgi:hypothetical protein
VHAHPSGSAHLEEREHEVVVARVQVEPEVDDRARLDEVGVRLLDRAHGRKLRELRDRVVSRFTTTRLGMLYATIGRSVTAAISSKWRTIPRTGGLL